MTKLVHNLAEDAIETIKEYEAKGRRPIMVVFIDKEENIFSWVVDDLDPAALVKALKIVKRKDI